ncbi:MULTISPECIES: hypothetical protein [unclassified Crossiella]|uniref:hypothetical protein n=1 Tax=unclassified Crossiella TaxID=2620835 RepID=UPI001FFF4979|nr:MULTISPECIES: hypothetical protein [unclassified Crossiella]MCK2240475.1 hypothetical protein [Crossiella sp. S99.2]MCK2253074.1 hypothetical protein [Crossiella sp. S99.1]
MSRSRSPWSVTVAANGPGRRWLVWAEDWLAVLCVYPDRVEPRWAGRVEWLDPGELRWADEGWVQLPSWVAAGRPPRPRWRTPG